MQDGTVRAWGSNFYGQLGDGTTTSARLPRTVVGLSNVTQVAAGRSYACATTANGLACWGDFGGLLADDLSSTALVPRTNVDVEPVAITTGWGAMCGNFGTEWRCWTNIANLGTGQHFMAQVVTPLHVLFPSGLSGSAALGLAATGALVVAPISSFGESLILEQCTAAAAAPRTYCAVVAGGDVYCGGYGGGGETGSGSLATTPLNAPTRAVITQATAIAAGGEHFCALRRDRTVACWGQNRSGQVGADLFGTVATTPTQVPVSDVTQLALGSHHSCALKSDGNVWCWGENSDGQLGDGTNITRFAPVRVQL